jgi:hypothetical protein
LLQLQSCSELVAVRLMNNRRTTGEQKRGSAMLGIKLRFYFYLVVCAALLVMLVFDPHLLASSGIAAAFASVVALLRGAFAG